MTSREMVLCYGADRFALRVPADCLETVLPELDDACLSWDEDHTSSSDIPDSIMMYYCAAEKMGCRPCLMISPSQNLISWCFAHRCEAEGVMVRDFAEVLAHARHEIPVLIPNETLIAAIYEV